MEKHKPKVLSIRVIKFFILIFATGLIVGILFIAAKFRNDLYPIIPVISIIFLSISIYAAIKLIYIPYTKTEKILHLFASGYTIQGIYELPYPLSPGMEATTKKLKDLLDSNEQFNANMRQAHYLALQNQINPHFLYNTLEGIRGECLAAGLNTVADMTEALGTFFRYTISNVENLVTLADEIINIQNYCLIQKYRFGERLRLIIDYDGDSAESIGRCHLPKLTLQPIVENAIVHGIERKMGQGVISIRIVTSEKRLIITISDNGLGMEEETLHRLNKRLNTRSIEYMKPENETDGIALFNVNNRIRLLFGEEFGINLFSTLHVGTDVEINLPLVLTKETGVPNEKRNVKNGTGYSHFK